MNIRKIWRTKDKINIWYICVVTNYNISNIKSRITGLKAVKQKSRMVYMDGGVNVF